jgi:hypothetical protein
MPVTTIYEYHFFSARKNQIGIPREFYVMQAVSVPGREHHFSNDQLRAGVFALNGAHYRTTFVR